jgi:hypothetical protein
MFSPFKLARAGGNQAALMSLERSDARMEKGANG